MKTLYGYIHLFVFKTISVLKSIYSKLIHDTITNLTGKGNYIQLTIHYSNKIIQ